jgi:AraC-like DNA-binding protein
MTDARRMTSQATALVVDPPAPSGTATLSALDAARASTLLSWQQAVERAVELMRARMSHPLALDAMAQSVLMSPYHFHRIFRLMTGIPPGRFLTALRMAEAKRLLLCTSLRVTEICFAVGFESLGTFTTRFGQLVGTAPQKLRRLAEEHGRRPLASIARRDPATDRADGSLSAWLDVPAGRSCVALVGLFERAVPQGLPSACDALGYAPGEFRIGPVAPGRYCPLAVGFPEAETVLDATLLDPRELLVGTVGKLIPIGRGGADDRVRLRMDIPGPIDPPIVLAAPLLAAAAKSAVARSL